VRRRGAEGEPRRGPSQRDRPIMPRVLKGKETQKKEWKGDRPHAIFGSVFLAGIFLDTRHHRQGQNKG